MNDRANYDPAEPTSQADANERPQQTGEPRWVTDISIVTVSRTSDDQPNPKPASLVELRQLEPLPNTEVGAGGFGVVSRTQDEFGRLVAIKQLRDELNQDETARLRFRVEAEIAAELHEHRGVIPVLRRNIEGQRLWYSMPYVRDGNLASAIAAMRTGTDGEADRRSLLRRFVDVCQTIDYAHSRGVIHGDISPRNVLLGRFGTTYVIDWGLARWGADLVPPHHRESDQPPTFMSVSLGALAPAHWGGLTLAYSSPEHRANQPLTHAADVFSLGVVLREIVTRSHDETVARVALQSAPRRLRAIVERATKTIPEERYSGAHQLASDVLAFLDEGSLLAAPDRRIDRFRKFTWRHRGWLSALLFVVVLSAGVFAFLRIQAGDQLQLLSTQTINAYGDYVTAVMEAEVLTETRLQPLRKKLLEQAEQFYSQQQDPIRPSWVLSSFVSAASSDDLQRRLQSLIRLAEIKRETVGPKQAVAPLRTALTLGNDLLQSKATDPATLSSVIRIESLLGQVLVQSGEVDEGIELCRRAIARLERSEANLTVGITPQRLEAQRLLVNAAYRSADGARYREMMELADREAEKWWQLAQEALRQHPTNDAKLELARALNGRALTAHKTVPFVGFDRPEVERVKWVEQRSRWVIERYDEAIELIRSLRTMHGPQELYDREESKILSNQGMTFVRLKLYDEAIRGHERGVELRQAIARNNPLIVEDQRSLAVSYGNLADAMSYWPDLKRRAPEIVARQNALNVLAKTIELAPDVEVLRQAHSLHAVRGADLLYLSGRTTEAVDMLRASLKINPTPEVVEGEFSLSAYKSAFALLLLASATTDPQERSDFSHRAVAIIQRLLTDHPNDEWKQRFLTEPLWQIVAPEIDIE